MGLQDIDPFLDTPQGRVFFPYCRWAPGYLLAPSDEAPLRLFLRRLRWTSFALVLALLLVRPSFRGHDFVALLIVSALYAMIWLVAVRIRCRTLARTHGPIPALNITQRAAAALTDDFIELAQLACLLFATGGAAMFWCRIGDPAVDITVALIFGGYWLWYCRIVRIKRALP